MNRWTKLGKVVGGLVRRLAVAAVVDARGLDGQDLVVRPPGSPLSGRRQHPCSPKASVRQHTLLATTAELSSNHRWRWLDIKTHFLPFVCGCSLSLSGLQGQHRVQS